MADDDQKIEETKDQAEDAQEAADKATETAEAAAETVEEVKEEVKEVKKEIKEEKEEKKTSPKVSKKLEGVIEEIEKLSVLELSELVKALEAKFGVSAAASEQTTFNVVLAESGANKISVIKAVRELVPTL